MGKYYGVWIGRNPGVYDTWEKCKEQIDKFPNAKYKKLEATDMSQALVEFSNNNIPKVASSKKPTDKVLTVDGAANGIFCEYQAVWTTGEKVFASKQFSGGTNNIGEFLGLVAAIQYLEKNRLPLVIYTDSVTAMAWVRNCHANTTANATGKATKELDNLINEAEIYLESNKEVLQKTQILKWETKQWGEIPSDYGRK